MKKTFTFIASLFMSLLLLTSFPNTFITNWLSSIVSSGDAVELMSMDPGEDTEDEYFKDQVDNN